jgi:hypothetical protein
MKPVTRVEQTITAKQPSAVKPVTLADFQKEIKSKQDEITALNRQQYGAMLKGENPDRLDALKAQREAALKELQTQYAQAMGIGVRRPKNQLLPDTDIAALNLTGGKAEPLSTNSAADFWAGFKKGLGLQEGEEVGEESTGGLRDIAFAAQDVAAHTAGLDDEMPEPEPNPPHPASPYYITEDEGEGDYEKLYSELMQYGVFMDKNKYITEGEYEKLYNKLMEHSALPDAYTGPFFGQAARLASNREWSEAAENSDISGNIAGLIPQTKQQ